MQIKDIKKARKKAGMSVDDVAVRLGVTPMTVYRWEQGKRKPHLVFLRLLESILSEKMEGDQA